MNEIIFPDNCLRLEYIHFDKSFLKVRGTDTIQKDFLHCLKTFAEMNLLTDEFVDWANKVLNEQVGSEYPYRLLRRKNAISSLKHVVKDSVYTPSIHWVTRKTPMKMLDVELVINGLNDLQYSMADKWVYMAIERQRQLVSLKVSEIKERLVRLGSELHDVQRLPKLPIKPDWVIEI